MRDQNEFETSNSAYKTSIKMKIISIKNINDFYDFEDSPLTKHDLYKDINNNGWVYKAVDKLTNKVKAIKFIHKF